MGEFFRRCGIGIVVIVTSPLWLAFFALYIIYGLLLLVFSPLRFLFALIKHRKVTVKDEYDEAAERILAQQKMPSPAPEAAPRTVVYVTPPVNNVPYPDNTYNPGPSYPYPTQNNMNQGYLPPQGNPKQDYYSQNPNQGYSNNPNPAYPQPNQNYNPQNGYAPNSDNALPNGNQQPADPNAYPRHQMPDNSYDPYNRGGNRQ